MSAKGGVGAVDILLADFGSAVGTAVIVDIGIAVGGNSVSFAGWQLASVNTLTENVITVRTKARAVTHVA